MLEKADSSRPVNLCAASLCRQLQISSRAVVDMLRKCCGYRAAKVAARARTSGLPWSHGGG
jgi:hypothetical protein